MGGLAPPLAPDKLRPCISTLLSNLYTGLKFSSAYAMRFFLSPTKSSPPQNLRIYVILSRSLDVVTLSRPPSSSSSSLKVNNCSFRHASFCLWNQFPKELRLPVDHEDLALSSDLTHVSSFSSSPLSLSITSSLFHSRLKAHLFHKSFPP